jgi:hypothetical protein
MAALIRRGVLAAKKTKRPQRSDLRLLRQRPRSPQPPPSAPSQGGWGTAAAGDSATGLRTSSTPSGLPNSSARIWASPAAADLPGGQSGYWLWAWGERPRVRRPVHLQRAGYGQQPPTPPGYGQFGGPAPKRSRKPQINSRRLTPAWIRPPVLAGLVAMISLVRYLKGCLNAALLTWVVTQP